jgi:hypothetical protein
VHDKLSRLLIEGSFGERARHFGRLQQETGGIRTAADLILDCAASNGRVEIWRGDDMRRALGVNVLSQQSVAVISPHLDDAVLSCGALVRRRPLHSLSLLDARNDRLLRVTARDPVVELDGPDEKAHNAGEDTRARRSSGALLESVEVNS